MFPLDHGREHAPHRSSLDQDTMRKISEFHFQLQPLYLPLSLKSLAIQFS